MTQTINKQPNKKKSSNNYKQSEVAKHHKKRTNTSRDHKKAIKNSKPIHRKDVDRKALEEKRKKVKVPKGPVKHTFPYPTLYYIYAIIRQFFQPYWSPNQKRSYAYLDKKKALPLQTKQDDKKVAKAKVIRHRLSKSKEEDNTDDRPSMPAGEVVQDDGEVKSANDLRKRMTIMSVRDKFDQIKDIKSLPKPRQILFYHDSTVHEIITRLPIHSGFTFMNRSNQARTQLKPMLYPIQDKAFDRTHVLPIGYHGSENDARLVVGWDSEQNRGPLNKFEQKQKDRKREIYWETIITKTSDGARWRYLIYDVKTMQLLDSLDISMKCRFMWKS